MKKPEVKRQSASMKGTKGTSFSVRLTEDERDLLARAAHKRGWTSTTLLKAAALERAIHILNTETLNTFDFKTTARSVAVQIFAARTAKVVGEHGELENATVFETIGDEPHLDRVQNPVQVWPYEMPLSFVEKLKDALRLGGAEFLKLVVEVSEELTSRTQRILPEPIEPSRIVKLGEKDAV